MYCLYCGDCCKRMSPLSNPNPCPHIVTVDNFYFCGIYPNRSKECIAHEYPARFCPIGIDVMKINRHDTEALRNRIDNGWELIKHMTNKTGGNNEQDGTRIRAKA